MNRLLLLLFLLTISFVVFGQDDPAIPGELIVQIREGKPLDVSSISRANIDLKKPHKISTGLNIYVVKYDPTVPYEVVVAEINKTNEVLHIMPNMRTKLRRVPNDEHYSKQEDLRRIDIERAWSVTTGGETALGDRIVVAILDSGYGVDIQDISENQWFNKAEQVGDANGDGCPGDCGVDDDMDGMIDEDAFGRIPAHPLYNPSFADDDDENGYKDDIGGLNLGNLTDVHPRQNHGTAVAGIVGAAGNNSVSVAGINWDVEMMLFSDVVNIAQIIEAYNYVYEQRRMYNESGGSKGAYVVVTNFSSGIDNEMGKDFPLWCNVYDQLGSVGILSVGATTNSDRNVDEEGDLPTTCESPYLISVTNTDENDRLHPSGYGPIHIDLGAPGQGTITTNLTNSDNVGSFSGTSAAAPHVAGAIALLHSIPCESFATYYKENPEKVTELKDYVLNATDPLTDLKDKTVSGGKLNVYSTMVALKEFCPGGDDGALEITNMYPNPSYGNDRVLIEYQAPEGVTTMQFLMYDMMGELVSSEEFNPPLYGKKVYEARVRTSAHGLYYFVIKSEKEITARKQMIKSY